MKYDLIVIYHLVVLDFSVFECRWHSTRGIPSYKWFMMSGTVARY